MKKASVILISLLVLMLGNAWLTPNAFAKDAAILVCSASGADPVIVQNYTASAGAPSIAVGTSCADAIATLLDAKFKIRHVESGDLRGGYYLFVK